MPKRKGEEEGKGKKEGRGRRHTGGQILCLPLKTEEGGLSRACCCCCLPLLMQITEVVGRSDVLFWLGLHHHHGRQCAQVVLLLSVVDAAAAAVRMVVAVVSQYISSIRRCNFPLSLTSRGSSLYSLWRRRRTNGADGRPGKEGEKIETSRVRGFSLHTFSYKKNNRTLHVGSINKSPSLCVAFLSKRARVYGVMHQDVQTDRESRRTYFLQNPICVSPCTTHVRAFTISKVRNSVVACGHEEHGRSRSRRERKSCVQGMGTINATEEKISIQTDVMRIKQKQLGNWPTVPKNGAFFWIFPLFPVISPPVPSFLLQPI